MGNVLLLVGLVIVTIPLLAIIYYTARIIKIKKEIREIDKEIEFETEKIMRMVDRLHKAKGKPGDYIKFY